MIAVTLMRPDPVVEKDTLSLKIDGAPSRLLRLLALEEGRTVSKEAIASLNDTASDNAASKIRDLRTELGEMKDIVVTHARSGYSLDLSLCSVDALEFRRAVEPIITRRPFPSEHLDPATAVTEVVQLKQALQGWAGNPASGLPATNPLHAAYDSLEDKVRDRLVVAQLFTGDEDCVRDGIATLEYMVSSGDGERKHWHLLLLAYDAIDAKMKIDQTWGRISSLFGNNVPPVLGTTLRGINGHESFSNPFRISQSDERLNSKLVVEQGTSEHERTIAALCTMLGITTASRLRLADSQLTPIACIRRTKRRLWFSGVLASKWVTEPAVRSELDELLRRLDSEKGDVRFMMINPEGEGYARLHHLRRGKISTESVGQLRKLSHDHESFNVRVFDALPSFRTVVIDDDVVSFSPYRLAADAYLATDRGWEAPHVVLDPLAPYPLAEAFQLLFEETWASATPLEEIHE